MPGSQRRQPVRFLVFLASLRRDSLNTRLAELAAAAIEAGGGDVDVAAMRDFDAPSYDQDVQREEGFPPGAEESRRRLEAGHGFVVASPEYNASMPGALKNAIDWVSRYQPQPLNERHGLLMSASPSMGGGNRGLWALRVPFEHLGSRLYPDMFSLARAHLAFTAEGRIADEQLQRRFDANISNFMDQVEASTHYPCVKRPGWSTWANIPSHRWTAWSDAGRDHARQVRRIGAVIDGSWQRPVYLDLVPDGPAVFALEERSQLRPGRWRCYECCAR
jgi:chromate reductase